MDKDISLNADNAAEEPRASLFVPEVQGQLRVFCAELARTVQEHFRDAENCRKFEDWYRKETGKEYEWRYLYQ